MYRTAEARKLRQVKAFIEKQRDAQITEQGLKQAIRLINKERVLLKNNYKFRNGRQPPKMGGGEGLGICSYYEIL